MWEYLWIVVVIGLIGGWIVAVYYFQRRGLLERAHLQPAGPFLMWKTVRGRKLIERIARPKRFWRAFGTVSVALVVATMVATTVLLAWEATLVQTPAVRENAPSPQLLLGLPGINPLIPLWYGIFGLAIAVVLHEFAHGILSRVANVRIKSLGAIFFLVPIGAFVEPDEEEMKALPRKDRMRLYAVGPATNIVLAVVFAVLFSSMMLGSVQPARAGLGIVGFSEPDSPAQQAGMQLNTIITAYNGTPIQNSVDFQQAKALTRPGQIVLIRTFDPATKVDATYSVTLAQDPSTGGPLIGVFGFDTNTDFYYPLQDPQRFGGIPGAILMYVSLPFQGRAPLQAPATTFYEIQGPFASVPGLFYLIANSFYWLFWLNVMLGATNALPAVPLDGGYIFKDAIGGLVARFRRGIAAEARDRIANRVSYAFALFILALILWQLIGPRI